jgi:DNA-binding CsgD family transcriptional regulator
MSSGGGAPAILGRERELAILDGLLDGVAAKAGGALLLRGETGVGKSALLDAAARRAAAKRCEVLRLAGERSAATTPFAALRAVVDVPEEPSAFLPLALGVLDRLSRAAAATPLVIVADDAQWLDRQSWEVLAFVARRLDAEPIAVVAAACDEEPEPRDGAGLPELVLEPLDDGVARAVLDAHAPGLPPALAERVLREAQGNPLALVAPTRLEHAFAERIGRLPPMTRTLLLVAALDEADELAAVLGATARVAGRTVTLEDIGPAVTARLVGVDGPRIAFRHPLARAAARRAGGPDEQQAVHAAYADVLAADPDRRAKHRAAAVSGPDAAIADELEAAARRALGRGAFDAALASLEHAAALSPEARERGRRLVDAAELAFQLGRGDTMQQLLARAEALDLDPADRERIGWDRGLFDDGAPASPDTIRALAAAGERAAQAGDLDRATDLLSRAGELSWAAPDGAMREVVAAAIDRVGGPGEQPALLLGAALAFPERFGAQVLETLARLPSDGGGDADGARLLGLAAGALGDDVAALRFLPFAVDRLRSQRRDGLLVRALAQRAWSLGLTGVLDAADRDAEEALRLAEQTAQPVWGSCAASARAMAAGIRGDLARAESHAAEAERLAAASGASAALADVATVRGLAALGAGDSGAAFTHLARLFDPGDALAHPVKQWWAIGLLAEAAAGSGRAEAARAHAAALAPVAARLPSPRLRAGVALAEAVLAGEDDAEARFRSALAAVHVPLDRARLQLAFGAWLRLRRDLPAARAQLTAAVAGFTALGAVRWAERANGELRAAGVSVRRRRADAVAALTDQELRIARMAASGMSNRDIAAKVYLSHRTVGAHLYRIFPKLGVTSRAELRDALGDEVI